MSQVPERIVGHSPGPWHVDRDTSDDPETLILGVKDVLIGEAYETASPDDFHVAEANARLMAAAPELLEVAQRTLSLLEHVSPDLPDVGELRALIARATGEQP